MGGPGEYGKAPSRSHISKIFVGRLTDKITDTQLREFFDAEAKKNFEGASVCLYAIDWFICISSDSGCLHSKAFPWIWIRYILSL